jgi:outer membrane protein assembly factor BamB
MYNFLYSGISRIYGAYRDLSPERRILLLVIGALLWRLTFFAPLTMELDTHFYASMARDLRDGIISGRIFSLPPLNENIYGIEYRPPLYPLLAALASPAAGGVEGGLLAVSLVAGTLLVIPVFLMARMFFGDPAGDAAAFMVITNPWLTYLSCMGLSESLYITLFAFAVMFTLWAKRGGRPWDYVLSGLFWGLACETRTEALAGAALAGAVFLWGALKAQGREERRGALKGLALFALALAVLVLPYALVLGRSAGGIHLTSPAKGIYDLSEGLFVEKGGGYREFNYRFGAPGEYGYRRLLTLAGGTAGELYRRNLSFIAGRTLKSLPVNLWTARSVCSYFLIMLLFLPFLMKRFSPARAPGKFYIFFLAVLPAVVLQFWDPNPRYFAGAVPLAAVAASGVIVALARRGDGLLPGKAWDAAALYVVPLSLFSSWYVYASRPFSFDFFELHPSLPSQLLAIRPIFLACLAGAALLSALLWLLLRRVSPFLAVLGAGAGLLLLAGFLPGGGGASSPGFFDMLAGAGYIPARSLLWWVILLGLYYDAIMFVRQKEDSGSGAGLAAVALIFLAAVSLQNSLVMKHAGVAYRYGNYSDGAVSRLPAGGGVPLMCAHPRDAFVSGSLWIKLPLTDDGDFLKGEIFEHKPRYVITDSLTEEISRDRSMLPALLRLEEEGVLIKIWQGDVPPPGPGMPVRTSRLFQVAENPSPAGEGGMDKEKLYDSIPWAVFRGDSRNTGRTPFNGPGPGALVSWRFKAGHEIFSSPVIDRAGNVYFGCDDSWFYCLDKRGRLRWRYRTGYYVSAPAGLWEKGVIVGSNDQHIYSFDYEGKLRWKLKTGYYISSGPLLTRQGIVMGGEDGWVYALDYDGKLQWKHHTGDEVIGTPAMSADGSTLYVPLKKGKLLALDRDGSRKWEFVPGGGLIGSPVAGEDGSVYLACGDGNVYRLGPGGKVIWQARPGGAVEASPALAPDGSLYVGSKDGFLYCLGPDGKTRWRYRAGYSIESSPVVDGKGRIYFGSHDRAVHCVDARGEGLFRVFTGGAVICTPAVSPGGSLYAGSLDGYLYCIKDPLKEER